MPSDPGRVETEIIDLTHDGQGVADLGDRRVFVAGALPGERVSVLPRRRRRRYEEAQLIEILEPAAARVSPPCEYFGRCGGCALQHLAYEAQVQFKESVVREAFSRLAGIEPGEWLPAITGPEWNYRRRARLGVRFVEGKDRVLVGFRERGARFITDMETCRVLVHPMDTVPGDLARMIAGTTLQRRLPQAELAVGDTARAVVLRVLDKPSSEDLRRFADFGRERDIDMFIQPGGPGSVEALDPEGATPLAYALAGFGVTLEFAATDFVQVNAQVNASLVRRTVGLLDVGAADRVLDLYCGLGNFSLPLATRAGEVLGVESDAGLVARAARNALSNGLGNARFVTADLAAPEWSFMRESWDLALLDPPRSGAPAAVAQMGRMGPRRLAYISCHPATLARDAKELVTRQGYRLIAAGIADMFPHTHHVEAMALFERR
jgi:23S rRNA (uracil1939-C5)-methyltransferase